MIRAALAGLALAAIAAASPARAEVHEWRHGIIEPKSDAGFAILPLQARFTEPFGLNVTIVNVQSDQVGLKALLAGDLNSYEGAPNSAIVAATHGADVKIIACAWPQLVQGIFLREPAKTLADLKGQAVAISAPGSMPDMVMHAALREANVPASEVKFASLGSDADRFKNLSAGVVSGAVVSTEFAAIAPPDVKLYKPLREVYPNFLRGCIMTTSALIEKRRADVVHLVAAEIRGLRYAVSHRDETLQLTQEVTKAKADDPRAAYIFDNSIAKGDLDPDLKLPVDKVAWMQDLLAEGGSVKQKMDVSKLVDTTIWPEAMKLATQ